MARPLIQALVVVAGLLLPGVAAAQTGTVGGTVQDSTGGVLPGVTVEAASPALIEKVRSVVTDAQGVYRIVDLRPGTYSVTFTLPGFSTVKREGVELSAGVTVNVTAELKPGAVEETITVTGQTPLVDVQNAAQHRTITQEMFDTLPAGRQMSNMAVLIPGVFVTGAGNAANTFQSFQDVGTNLGDRNMFMSIHGSNGSEMPLVYDGMRINGLATTGGGGASGAYIPNSGTIQEIAIDTSGASAEYEVSGVRANLIPKQGGNRYSAYFLANYAGDEMQANNLDDHLRSLGVKDPYKTIKTWDINPAVGGPLRRDKIWFYYSYRYVGTTDAPPGAYKDSDPNDWVYTPDTSTPSTNTQWTSHNALRITTQTSKNSKLAVYGDYANRCWCQYSLSATRTFEASQYFRTPRNSVFQGTWNWTATNRLLFELGQTWKADGNKFDFQPGAFDRAAATEQTSGVAFRATSSSFWGRGDQYNNKAVMSFVTGSQSLKVGVQTEWGHVDINNFSNTDYTVTLSGGKPLSITFRATPYSSVTKAKLIMGLFAQEQYTRKNLTVNLGLRMDSAHVQIPARVSGATRFVGVRSYPLIDDVPNWKDIEPRFGVTYDLFGNGKTALKWNLSRYIEGVGAAIANPVNPSSAATNTATTRSWTDNGDFIPQESELGPNNNNNFGSSNLLTTSYAPDTATGWGHRLYNWETMTGIQHELRPGVSVEAAYFRRWYGNFRVTDNTLVAPNNYDPFSILVPVDSRLPTDVSGQVITGFYNITPTLFGQNINTVTLAEKFGEQTQVYDGVDLTMQVRLSSGLMVQGGLNRGRTKDSACFVVDSPQDLRFCDTERPFQSNIKFVGIYRTPFWGLLTSATYQSLPGTEILATWAAPAANVQGLGRVLSGGARTVAGVQLIEPGTMYGERVHQVDLRLSKRLAIGSARLEPQFDLYNLFNVNPVLKQNNTFPGTAASPWGQPLAIMSGRLIKVGLQVNF